MSKTSFNFNTLVQRCEMADYKVRYRINQLRQEGKNIGKEVTSSFTLYNDADVKKITGYEEKRGKK